ncbi:MAG TPA: hypothetical protein VGC53_00705 [Vicinamibacteria bacterium]
MIFTLLNPAVLIFAAPVVFFSAGIAFVLIYYWLRDTVMWMSMTCMYVFSIAEVLFVGLKYDPWLAWPGSYTLFAAAGFSKVVFKRRVVEVDNDAT